jgi:uncharacterized protein involved in exopolysaccharide biosynthesis
MNLVDLLRALYSRRLILCGIFLAVVGAGMIVTFLLTPTYQSTMKILVTRDRIDPQVTPGEKNFELSRGELTEEDLNSEIEILQSRAVVEGAVRQLGLDHQYAEAPRGWLARLCARPANFYRSFHHQAAPDPVERAVTNLTEHLEIVSIKKSRIIKLTYRDSNPERAAQALNELYRQYGEHQLRLRQNSKAANVFNEQSEEFNQKLQAATETLKRFDARTGVTANTAQQGLLQQQFYEVQSQLDKTRTEMRETEQRIAALNAQIKTQPERIESEARTKYVPALDKIKDEIMTLELQRTQLLQKYQPNHRLVKEVEERLAQSRELLAREEKSPPQERATVLNDLHRRLTGELLSAQANLATLRERAQRLATLAAQYRAKVTRFDTKSLERADLERMRAVNEEAYLLYRKKAQEADIVNALNQERILNFSLAEAPGVNRKPISPKPLINLAVLVLVGLVAAVAIVAFIERNRMFLTEANLMAAIRADSPPLTEGDHAVLLRRATLLLSEGSPQRNGRQTPDDAEGALPAREQPTSTSNVDQATDGVNPPESGSAAARNGGRTRRITKAFPDSTDSQYQKHSPQNSLADGKPEAWRVKAVVDYLHSAYRLPSEKLSEVLRETVGWEISPAEIDEMLSQGAPRQSGMAKSLPDPQPDKLTTLLRRD